MYLGTSADRHPDKPAVIFADQDLVITYRQLDERSSRLAHALRAWGLKPGDGLAVVLTNEEHFFDFYWAAMRSGLYFTPVNWHLSSEEMEYVIDDCDARVLVASARFAEQLGAALPRLKKVERRISVGGEISGFERYEDAVASFPATRIADEREGAAMLYSSGTTGRPKGVRPPLTLDPAGTGAVLNGVGRLPDVLRPRGDRPLPLARTAVPRRTARLHDPAAPHRRDRRRHGALRPREGAALHRAPPGDARASGSRPTSSAC